MRRALKDRNGFSIAELLVASFFATMLGGAAWVLVSANQMSWSQGDAMVATTDQTRIALYRLTSDLRQALASSLNLSNTPGENQPLQAGNQLLFTTPAGSVTYGLLTPTPPNGRFLLMRNGVIVGRNISRFTYACPTQPGCPTDFPTPIPNPTSLLRITLETTEDALLTGGGKRPIKTSMSTQVALRRSAP